MQGLAATAGIGATFGLPSPEVDGSMARAPSVIEATAVTGCIAFFLRSLGRLFATCIAWQVSSCGCNALIGDGARLLVCRPVKAEVASAMNRFELFRP